MDLEKSIEVKGSIHFGEIIDDTCTTMLYIFILVMCYIIIFILNIMSSSIKQLIFFIIFIHICSWVGIKIFIYKNKIKYKYSCMNREQIYIINNKGITRKTEKNSVQLNWCNINYVIERNISFEIYVCQNNKLVNKIPPNFFTNEPTDTFEQFHPITIPKRILRQDNLEDFKQIVRLNLKNKSHIRFKK